MNLVSQLEYEMQPLHKKEFLLSKLLRSYVADLLNRGVLDCYNIQIEISPNDKNALLDCDDKLILRAVNNLVQNSIKHNPNGYNIGLSLTSSKKQIIISVADDGIGLSAKKMQELKEKTHYMNSTDERLDL